MNIKFILTGLILSLSMISQSALATEDDFDKVCGYFQALEKNNAVDTMTHQQRNDFILARINKNLKPTSNARAAWEAISNAEGSQRYEIYKFSAETVLKTKWNCDAMDKLAEKTGEF